MHICIYGCFVYVIAFSCPGLLPCAPIVFNLLQLVASDFNLLVLSSVVWIDFDYHEDSALVFNCAEFPEIVSNWLQFCSIFFNSEFSFIGLSWLQMSPNCLQMSSIVCNCLRLSSSMLKRLQLPSTTFNYRHANCSQLSSIVFDYLLLS